MSRKRKKAKDAVPDEILAEGSGPHQDVPHISGLAEAASRALSDEEVAEVGDETELASDEVLYEAEPVARKRRGKRTNVSREDAAVVGLAAADDVVAHIADIAEDDAMAAVLADSEVGPELEEAEVEAEQAARADEQGLEEAVMRAEAEAELGTAEPEVEAGEEDLVLGAALPTTAASMDDLQLKHLVEALIFAADKPVTLLRLRQLTRVSDVKRLEAALAALAEDFVDRGIALTKVSGGYQFRTNTQFSVWVQQLIAGRPVRLSRAQLETLAIVAYRQPITRPEVDDIRGVDSSATLRLLMDRSLIRILGKKEEVGRPLLYGTTREFLDFFSLGDLRELPTLREYSELSAESRQVMSDRLGLDADGNAVGEVGEDAESEGVEGMDVASAPEPTLDEMVREFAQSDVETHVGTDVAAMDASASEVGAGEDMTATAAGDDMTAAADEDLTVAADDMTAAADMTPQSDVETHVGTDVAAMDASAADDTTAAADDMTGAADEMTAAADMAPQSDVETHVTDVAAMDASAADDMTAAADEHATATADDMTAAPDEDLTAAADEMTAAADEMTAAADMTPKSDVETHVGTDVAAMDASAADDMTAAADDMIAAADEMTAAADEGLTAAADEMIAAGNDMTAAADEDLTAAGNDMTAADDMTAAADMTPQSDVETHLGTDVAAMDASAADEMTAAADMAPQSDVETHVGTDVAAMDASAADDMTAAADEDLTAAADEMIAAVGNDMTAAADEMTAAADEMTSAATGDQTAEANDDVSAAGNDITVAADEDLTAAADDMRATAADDISAATEDGAPAATAAAPGTIESASFTSIGDALKAAVQDAAGGESASTTDATDELSVSRTLDSTDEPPTD